MAEVVHTGEDSALPATPPGHQAAAPKADISKDDVRSWLSWCLIRMHILNHGGMLGEHTCGHIDCDQIRDWLARIEPKSVCCPVGHEVIRGYCTGCRHNCTQV